jgi:hypothetical protein
MNTGKKWVMFSIAVAAGLMTAMSSYNTYPALAQEAAPHPEQQPAATSSSPTITTISSINSQSSYGGEYQQVIDQCIWILFTDGFWRCIPILH